MNLNTIMQDGIKRIYDTDAKTQYDYIDYICSRVRNMDSTVIYEAKGFFIPNDDYLLNFFSEEIMNPAFEIYNVDGRCNWTGYLVLPIMDISGAIKGLGGFNPEKYIQSHETGDWSLMYYKYSSKNVFTKGNYIYTLPETYDQALDAGYIIITDGLFDTLSLIGAGYYSGALLGSSLTEVIIAQLRFFKKVILINDNDEAGLILEKNMKRHLHNVISLHQGKTKDVDDLLKTGFRGKFLEILDMTITEEMLLDKCAIF